MNFKKIFQAIILTVIVAVAITLGIYNIYLLNQKSPSKILSPLGNSFSIFSMFNHSHKPKKIVYGYLPYWSVPDAQYLQLNKITDIAYFGIYINEDGTLTETLEDGTTEPGLATWRKDKDLDKFIKDAKSSGVRVALTIISHKDDISDKFLDCRTCWDTLLTNVEKELESKHIKDVNFNFEYADLVEDKTKAQKYTELVEYFNKQLDSKYGNSFVVVATFADSLVKPRVTDVASLGKVADMLFIMAYDFHRPDSDNAGPVAPIDGKGVYADYDIRTMLTDYLANVQPNKIVLGVPYYGYNWVVKEGEPNSERIPGSDDIGYSQSQTYSQIMDTILELKPEVKWDELGQVPFFTYTSPETNQTREVYFENDKSLEAKYKLIKENNLAGLGIWALGYDGGYTELWQVIEKEFDGE
jgi:spore germination protein YaaH